MENKKGLIYLFTAFLKIGAFTFGGGYAMIPLIKKELVDNRKWINEDDILDIMAIAESTPGPIAINAATFVGYKCGGFLGALLATLGVIIPSFLIIVAIFFVLNQFSHLSVIRYAFWGVKAGVLALIVNAFYMMYRQCPKKLLSYVIMIAAFVLAAFVDINVIFVIIGCAALGIVSTMVAVRRNKQ